MRNPDVVHGGLHSPGLPVGPYKESAYISESASCPQNCVWNHNRAMSDFTGLIENGPLRLRLSQPKSVGKDCEYVGSR